MMGECIIIRTYFSILYQENGNFIQCIMLGGVLGGTPTTGCQCDMSAVRNMFLHSDGHVVLSFNSCFLSGVFPYCNTMRGNMISKSIQHDHLMATIMKNSNLLFKTLCNFRTRKSLIEWKSSIIAYRHWRGATP